MICLTIVLSSLVLSPLVSFQSDLNGLFMLSCSSISMTMTCSLLFIESVNWSFSTETTVLKVVTDIHTCSFMRTNMSIEHAQSQCCLCWWSADGACIVIWIFVLIRLCGNDSVNVLILLVDRCPQIDSSFTHQKRNWFGLAVILDNLVLLGWHCDFGNRIVLVHTVWYLPWALGNAR